MIARAKQNLISKLHTLPEDVQKDVKVLLEALEEVELKIEKDLLGEIWKDVEGFEGLYKISNFGRVKSLHKKRPRILLPYCDGKTTQYPRVNLCKNNTCNPVFIHVLVARAFIPNPMNKPEVNHAMKNDKNIKIH